MEGIRTRSISYSVIFLLIACCGYLAVIVERPEVLILMLAVITFSGLLLSVIVLPVAAIILAPITAGAVSLMIGPLNLPSIVSVWFLSISVLVLLPKANTLINEKMLLILVTFLSLALISVTYSTMKSNSLKETAQMASSFVMMAVVYAMAGRKENRRIILIAVLCSTLIPLSVGLYQSIMDIGTIGDAKLRQMVESGHMQKGFRIYATFWDVNTYAIYLMIAVTLLWSLNIIRQRSIVMHFIAMTLFVLASMELVLTYSRAKLIGFGFAVSVILVALKKTRILLFLIPYILIFLYFTEGFNRFSELLQPIDFSDDIYVNSLESRFHIWMRAINLIIDQPFYLLFGRGPGSFSLTIGRLPHNDYLGLLFELGIIGPILYFLFLYTAARISWYIYRLGAADPMDKALALTVLGVSVAILVQSLAANLFYSRPMWWIYLPLLACTLRVYRDELHATETSLVVIDKIIDAAKYRHLQLSYFHDAYDFGTTYKALSSIDRLIRLKKRKNLKRRHFDKDPDDD